MGVTGLWTVVQPCARPIKIETLNKKRLAVDASIWIYQFLKAVRDKEGNALRNSHVVGFFRRICKLLFIGIKPVFVFDGGAPALKRQTVAGRKARREGRREDAVRTAGKLLAVQMQRRAEEEERRRKEDMGRPVHLRREDEEEEIPDNLVYVDELQMTAQERQQNRNFKKTDAYHLPELDMSLAEMGAPNDPRIMNQAELEEYARQFHTGEDINIYDFSKIDFNSPFFLSLPASDRYNILNAARLRSRLRMGYSKDQLDSMFPDRMAFSKFQIERVKERNDLTQRLMNLNGMNGEDAMLGMNDGGRVAGEKGKEYVLVKNDGVEGGWALGVVSNKQGQDINEPIDVEDLGKEETVEDNNNTEDDGFEDVPIEGLNRLPKRPRNHEVSDGKVSHAQTASEKRRALYKARRNETLPAINGVQEVSEEDPDGLFVPQESSLLDNTTEEYSDDLFEDVPISASRNDDEDLQRAIAMSLEIPADDPVQNMMRAHEAAALNGPPIDKPLEFTERNARAGRAFAHLTNARANEAAQGPFIADKESESDDDGNLYATLIDSKYTGQQSIDERHVHSLEKSRILESDPTNQIHTKADTGISPRISNKPQAVPTFDGPLPFESIRLGPSILKTKKKSSNVKEGGFDKSETELEKKVQPIPPWFVGDIREDTAAQKAAEARQLDSNNPPTQPDLRDDIAILNRTKPNEVIDLDAPRDNLDEIIEVESSSSEQDDTALLEILPMDSDIRVSISSQSTQAESPQTAPLPNGTRYTDMSNQPTELLIEQESESEGEAIEWEESDFEESKGSLPNDINSSEQNGKDPTLPISKPLSPPPGSLNSPILSTFSADRSGEMADVLTLAINEPVDQAPVEDIFVGEENLYSDSEDDELMRQLAIEAEEHARFASSLNAKSQMQSAEDYDRELRQLRNQQKKDRRDADEVSHIMITECQQLLQLFGLPYVTAPMEAEAQCAELVSLGLVDGIVTDDSDIFLFGGTRVYKNMFNQAKYVECYLSSDLEKEYSLDRHKVIQLAHLLGSDYTEGIPSIGPVTALEILSEFGDLDTFKDWLSQLQSGFKTSEDGFSPFRHKFKRSAMKLFLPPAFPDKRVDYAYLNPEVDSDPSPFQWGVPDLDRLRSFLMATIGWSQERADEILVPVIRDMNRRETEGTQANITQFFSGTVGTGGRQKVGDAMPGAGDDGGSAFAPRRRADGKSKRMETALGRLHARASNRTMEEGDDGAREREGSEAAAHGATVPEVHVTVESRSKALRKKPRARKRKAAVENLGSESSGDDYGEERPKKTVKGQKGSIKVKGG